MGARAGMGVISLRRFERGIPARPPNAIRVLPTPVTLLQP